MFGLFILVMYSSFCVCVLAVCRITQGLQLHLHLMLAYLVF